MPIANYLFSETSPAAAGTAASSQPVTGGVDNGIPNGVCGLLGDYEALEVVAELVGATGGTLNVYLQNSVDEGVTWFDVVAWPQLANGAAKVIYQSPLSNATTTTQTQVVGKNLSPALNSTPTATTPNVVNGAFTDRLRLVMVAGSGTSAGAAVLVHVCAQRARIRETGE
jgi:hypothetical protein